MYQLIYNKANKRLYFIVLFKRACVSLNDIVNFYSTTIRPALEYCAPVFHHTLPGYLNEDIERIQKRVLTIILTDMPSRECLDGLGLQTLYDRHNELCRQLFVHCYQSLSYVIPSVASKETIQL